jgi:plasmid segregation protein ParM
MILGLDLGYGYVKVTRDGKTVQSFPSVVGSGKERQFSNLFGSGRGLDEMAVEINEKTYYVGELAVAESYDASRAIDRNKTHHEATRVLIGTAVLLAQLPVDEPVKLYTGLPLEYVREQKDDFAATLQGMRFTVKGVSGPFQGVEREIRFDSVKVLPQAIGAAYAALMDEQGRPRYPELAVVEDPMALIDIGYRTTDFTVFQVRPRLRVLEELSGTVAVGAHTVYNMVRAAFPEIPERDVESAVSRENIWINGRTLDLRREVAEVRKSVAKTIADEVKHRWSDRMGRIRVVFLAGGGAKLLESELQTLHPDVRVVPEPQGANALGFWLMGRMAEIPKEPAGPPRLLVPHQTV